MALLSHRAKNWIWWSTWWIAILGSAIFTAYYFSLAGTIPCPGSGVGWNYTELTNPANWSDTCTIPLVDALDPNMKTPATGALAGAVAIAATNGPWINQLLWWVPLTAAGAGLGHLAAPFLSAASGTTEHYASIAVGAALGLFRLVSTLGEHSCLEEEEDYSLVF